MLETEELVRWCSTPLGGGDAGSNEDGSGGSGSDSGAAKGVGSEGEEVAAVALAEVREVGA